MGRNRAQSLQYGPRPSASGRTKDQGHSFFPHTDRLSPINSMLIFFLQ